MAKTRKNRLLALCLGTIFVFFVQSMVCFAKEVGVLPCCNQAEQHQAAGNDHQNDSSSSSDCCVCFPGTLTLSEANDFSLGTLAIAISVRPDDAAPDGPVYKIEYPPQLS